MVLRLLKLPEKRGGRRRASEWMDQLFDADNPARPRPLAATIL